MNLTAIVDTIVAVLIAIDVHELGHALVATWLGDSTPRREGHLSLNPFRHMDQFGILLLFLSSLSGMGFTYGFTPVNDRNLRGGPRLGGAVVAAAGPLANILTAALLGIPLRMSNLALSAGLFQLLLTVFSVNVFLAVFNLLPIPPLDGWRVLSTLLSPRLLFDLRGLVQYGPMILLLLIMLNPYLSNLHLSIFQQVVNPAQVAIEQWLG